MPFNEFCLKTGAILCPLGYAASMDPFIIGVNQNQSF